MVVPGIAVKHSPRALFKEPVANDSRALLLGRGARGDKIGSEPISGAGVFATGKLLKKHEMRALVLK